MPNPRNKSDLLNATDRIAEIGEILALGLIRLRARKSTQLSADRGDSSLDCVADQSGHANSTTENGR
jgi:hypothetical protein